MTRPLIESIICSSLTVSLNGQRRRAVARGDDVDHDDRDVVWSSLVDGCLHQQGGRVLCAAWFTDSALQLRANPVEI